MPSPKHPLKLHRSVPKPHGFHPTKTWVKHPYIYRYDPSLRVCKRTPIDDSARGVGGYFSVVMAVEKKSPFYARLLRHISKTFRLSPALAPRAFAGVFVIAAAVFTYPFVPALHHRLSHQPNLPQGVQLAKVPPAQPAKADNPTNRVIIPSIGVNTPILESSSLAILDVHEGVWHQTGTLQTSNFVIAGHRFKYLPPNTTTFYNLDKLAAGDVIVIDWVGKRNVYTVAETRTIKATEIGVIAPTAVPQLTIYTCSDKEETERIVVIARPLPKEG
ncbi:MAG TPA: sortase [Candidatus Saccharimonadia bacterium]